MRYSLVLLIVCCLLGACQNSPRKNYYLLTAAPTETTAVSGDITTLIGIGPIETAEYLNRLHIVYQANNGGLALSDNDYWAEPLRTGIPRVIGLNLVARDAGRGMVQFPWRRDSQPDFSVRLAIHDLSRVNNAAHINATWELMDTHEKTALVRRHFIRSVPVSSGARSLVNAYSKLLAELSAEMDQALTQHSQRP